MYLAQLDTEKLPKLLGDEYLAKKTIILKFLQRNSIPVDLVGPPGTGKSYLGSAIAIEYARTAGVPAYSIVLDEDTTKSGLIAGYRMVGGTTKVVPGAVAQAMEKGAILFVDEFTHGPFGLQTAFNTITDLTHYTVAGDQTYRAKDTFRVMFAHNEARYAGNQPIAPSTGSRYGVWRIDYPTAMVECQIAKYILLEERKKHGYGEVPVSVPDSILKYLVWVLREIRTDHPQLGLSARNVTIALAMLDALDIVVGTTDIDRHFSTEAVLQVTAERVLHKAKDEIEVSEYRSKSVRSAMLFITACGIEQFIDVVLGAFMYYLDIKGATIKADQWMKESVRRKIV